MLFLGIIAWCLSGHYLWLRVVLDEDENWDYPLWLVLSFMVVLWVLGPITWFVGWFLHYGRGTAFVAWVTYKLKT